MDTIQTLNNDQVNPQSISGGDLIATPDYLSQWQTYLVQWVDNEMGTMSVIASHGNHLTNLTPRMVVLVQKGVGRNPGFDIGSPNLLLNPSALTEGDLVWAHTGPGIITHLQIERGRAILDTGYAHSLRSLELCSRADDLSLGEKRGVVMGAYQMLKNGGLK